MYSMEGHCEWKWQHSKVIILNLLKFINVILIQYALQIMLYMCTSVDWNLVYLKTKNVHQFTLEIQNELNTSSS